jgi:hypothetical protein
LTDGYQQYINKQKEIQEQFNIIKKQQIENNVLIKSISEKINLFNQEKCPTCGTSFSSSSFNELKEHLNTLKNDKLVIDENIKKQINDLTSTNNTI